MDDAARVKLIKAIALAGISTNWAICMAFMVKKDKEVQLLVDHARDAHAKLDEGLFIMTTMSKVLTPTPEQDAEIAAKVDMYKWEHSMPDLSDLAPEPIGVAAKTSPLMRSNPSHQGDIMTEMNPETETPQVLVQEPPAEKPSRWRSFIADHPRAAKAAKLTAGALALVGVTRAVTNAQHNKEKLGEALEHTQEATDAFTDAVTVNPDES